METEPASKNITLL